MCSTPAPRSTTVVASCIWSGVGEVKTSPQHAASSMPGPTYPPWSGSWPEPPPEISATLPSAFGRRPVDDAVLVVDPELRVGRVDALEGVGQHVLGTVDELLHGQTSAGTARGRSGRRVGVVLGRVGNETEQRARPRHPRASSATTYTGHCSQITVAAHDLLDEHRAGGAGRVDRGAGGRRDRDDRGEDHHADGQAGPAGRRLAVDHAEHREHQQERADELGEERLVPRDRVAVRRDAEAEVAGLGAEHADDGEGSGDGAERPARRRTPGPPAHGNLPVAASPKVTAGLMWLPPM